MTWHRSTSQRSSHFVPRYSFLRSLRHISSLPGEYVLFSLHLPPESSYPKGAVVMSLIFHGIELFLKAAILEKVPNEQFSGNVGHDLDHLHKRYTNLYPGKKHAFEVPFRDEEVILVNPDPRILEELKLQIAGHKRATSADQLHRYHRDIKGKPWEGLFSFEASSFAAVIEDVQEDIVRLKGLIFNG